MAHGDPEKTSLKSYSGDRLHWLILPKRLLLSS